jgi:S-adenosylmethionine:tRNA ribosyltransferase-isomerase
MNLSDFDYTLPKDRIAQSPAEPRSSCRLMVLGDRIEHKRFYEIVDYFKEGDILVVNDSKVVPAKLVGRKETGGRVECLLVERRGEEGTCLIRGKKIRPGTKMIFQKGLSAVVTDKLGDKYGIRFEPQGALEELLERIGKPPTPPYIKREVEEREYQTVYASKPGSIAAPTAGLHFTQELLEEIKDKGARIAFITLHVGIGTFSPVKVEDPRQHRMEAEYFEIDEENAKAINDGERLIACGTTTVKALESAFKNGKIQPVSGWSDLFIYPPYDFRAPIDGIITNFHLPKSTLLMLVCAYAGRERILNAYREAIEKGYRFYSLGDAMFIKGGGDV